MNFVMTIQHQLVIPDGRSVSRNPVRTSNPSWIPGSALMCSPEMTAFERVANQEDVR